MVLSTYDVCVLCKMDSDILNSFETWDLIPSLIPSLRPAAKRNLIKQTPEKLARDDDGVNHSWVLNVTPLLTTPPILPGEEYSLKQKLTKVHKDFTIAEKAPVGTFSVIVNFWEPSFEHLVCKYLPGTRGTHFSCHEVLIFLPGSLDTGIHRTNQIGALGHVTRCRAGCDCDWSSRATLGAGGWLWRELLV